MVSLTEKQIRECIAGRQAFISEHYPHINIAIETEEIVAKYKHTTIGADPWLLVSRWLKGLSIKNNNTMQTERDDILKGNMEVCRRFAEAEL